MTAEKRPATRIPFRIRPMLATLVDEPFDRPGWVYEEKYDGYRILAYKEGGAIHLLSRNDLDRTATFAEIAEAIGRPARPDAASRRRGGGVRPAARLPLSAAPAGLGPPRLRRVRLSLPERPGPAAGAARRPPRRAREGRSEALRPASSCPGASRPTASSAYRIARRRGLEGIVAKDASSPYEERRGFKWLKVKVHQEEELVDRRLHGAARSRASTSARCFSAPTGAGTSTSSGRSEPGFPERRSQSLARKLRPLIRARPPFVDPPREKDATWLAPKLVAQIAFQEWTADRSCASPSSWVCATTRARARPGFRRRP